MTIEQALKDRSGNKCELCSSEDNLHVHNVAASADKSAGCCVYLCDTCSTQIENPEATDENHWRCLNDSMWSQVPAVQVMAYRQLKRLSTTTDWAMDLVDMMYLEDDVREWAEKGLVAEAEAAVPTLDSNGVALQAGDTVTIIKDLPVKGSSMVIKRGTAVRNISLTDNPLHIQGRADGVQMVIIAAYTKKN
ncbi:PhnA domain protein [Photobacterium damselae subsp. damselae]|uniref:PhnA domain-containing protein n=1 Tax=Photobacterium damselae TaxID=38293 RepID=UPI00084B5122|nr:PhnA domain-containing protein [Photobacterium damselae]OEC82477.1 PhnA domain protein [Photobacterium damselae subsp. damselae]